MFLIRTFLHKSRFDSFVVVMYFSSSCFFSLYLLAMFCCGFYLNWRSSSLAKMTCYCFQMLSANVRPLCMVRGWARCHALFLGPPMVSELGQKLKSLREKEWALILDLEKKCCKMSGVQQQHQFLGHVLHKPVEGDQLQHGPEFAGGHHGATSHLP